ncbi:hypothetical protein [Massilia sp. DD77]|uniref:RIFT barrel domain-containing protein n=1 Tax=Massilia sp. DD77 TaxID=3109349 RepID=UPI002FFED308
MKSRLNTLAARTLSTTLCGAVLVAFGGSNATAGSIYSGRSVTTTPTAPTTSTATTTPAPTAAAITNVRLENTSATVAQNNVPVTFGQVFAVGHLAKGTALAGRLDDGSALPLQVDVKATHPDGSVRHAVISAVLPTLGAGQTRTMELVPNGTAAAATTPSASSMLSNGVTASVSATIGGVRYTASADELIKAGKATTWLAGPTTSEWLVTAPLKTSSGVAHPHLSARFAVRWYEAAKKARVDVTLENSWAYEANPQNFTYDAEVMVSGKAVFTKPALTHLHHARWRQTFWSTGAAPTLNVKQNIAYLVGSRALPNFDTSLKVPETAIVAQEKRWLASNRAPMGLGMAIAYMPTTGGRGDIGLLPNWGAMYLLSMDRRMREATLGTADLAGSWSTHYRDKNTGQPISLIDYPYMTIMARPTDTKNPATGKYEAFPLCDKTTVCKTPYTHDVSHQPAFAYLPYLVTGDHYYLEELQFWSMYNVFQSHPSYRQNIKGLVQPEQVRGQAWSLRTLAEAAYITPDNDRLKSHFNRILDSNLDWYNATYSNNASANKLGAIVNGYAITYYSKTSLAPWMDDFFTSAIGHTAELGYTKAVPLLKWKVGFPVQRLTGAGACYIRAAMYTMVLRDSATSPVYSTIGEAFAKSDTKDFNADFLKLQCGSAAMATVLKLKTGEMTGYSSIPTGYPSNMQPAVAYAQDAGGTAGAAAWTKFMSRTVKPDYAKEPQFAIIPR